MNVVIFQEKKFSGGIQEVISQIKAEYANMLKQVSDDGIVEQQVDARLEQVKKEVQTLNIQLKKAQTEEKEGIKSKIEGLKSLQQKLNSIILVRRKIEELTNYSKSQETMSQLKDIDIQVFEIKTMQIPDVPNPDDEEIKDSFKDNSKSVIHKQCEEFMMYAKPMPECFEKTLIRICYCLSLLHSAGSKEDSDENIKDSVLFIVTKEKMLEQLKLDLGQIKGQMEYENFEESTVKTKIQEVIDYFAKTNQLFYNYELHLNSLLTALQKIVRPFNFQEFFDLVGKCETNSERIDKKDIILLLGTTGAGKSTTIQYLYGTKMGKSKKDGHIQAQVMPKQLEEFVSSSAMQSITRYINPLHVAYMNQEDEEESIEIVDTPGFGDTQSVEIDIANTLGIIRSVSKAKKVYPTFIFSEKNFGGRAEIMKGLIEFYSCLIKDMSKNVKSCNFFFSHFSDKSKDMENFINSVITSLNAQEHSKLILKDVLKYMRELGKNKKLLILDPLDGNHKRVLHQIIETKPITNPKNHFSLNIVERSRSILDKQVQLHEKFILEMVPKGETTLPLWKIDELIRLDEIFGPFEATYKTRLEQIFAQINSIVRKIIDNVLERIQVCMKGSNELYDTDINKFKEAIEFEIKIIPLMSRISRSDLKSDKKEEIQSDQHQQPQQVSQMVSAVISQCESILSQLDKRHEINEDEWIHFIVKSIKLSKNVAGFEQIQKNCLNRYSDKFQKFAYQALKIIEKVQITDYSSLSSYQSQSSREEMLKSKKQQVSSRKNFQEDQQDGGLKTDSDFEIINTSENQVQANPSDSQEGIQSDQGATKKINHRKFSNAQDKTRHNKFRNLVTILINSQAKIKVVEKQEFQDILQELIKDVQSSVLNLKQKVKPHFQLQSSIDKDDYRYLSQDEINDIKHSLTMLEQYHLACQNVDSTIQNNLSAVFDKYKKKCLKVFEIHYQKFIEIFQKLDVNKALEIKERFNQVELLRQIPQIEQSTNGPFHHIKLWLDNQIKVSINEVVEILQQFESFTSGDSESSDKKGLQSMIKRLNEALNSLKTLSEIYKSKQSQIKSMFMKLQNSFDKLLQKFEQDGNQFYNLSFDNPQNIGPISLIYQQVEEIYQAADIISIRENLKKDVGLEWVQSIKSSLLYIKSEGEKLKDKLMVQSDYRIYGQFHSYLKTITEGPSTLILIKKVNGLLKAENVPQVEPNQILSNLKIYLLNQPDKKKECFDQVFLRLQDLTSVAPSSTSEKAEESKEKNLKFNETEVGAEMKKIADTIIILFKIEYEVKSKYPVVHKQILESQVEDEFFLKYYTTRFNNEFFIELEKNQIKSKSTKWVFLKLQSIKYLRDLDELLYNQNIKIVQEIYKNLDDKYFQDPESEVQKAQANFQQNNFQEIKQQLDQLSQFPANENNQIIKKKIMDYLLFQINSIYEKLITCFQFDFSLNQTQIKDIAQNIEYLMRVNQYLIDDVKIKEKKIQEIINIEAIALLATSFGKKSDEIEQSLAQNNFFKAYEMIKQCENLYKTFFQSCGGPAKEISAFQKLKDTCKKIFQKIEKIRESIVKIFDKILSKNPDEYNVYLQPKALIENIKKITDEQIIEKLDTFEQQLYSKYNDQMKEIRNKRESTKDFEVLKQLKIIIEQLKDSLQYLPEPLKGNMNSRLSEEETQISSKKIELQEKEISNFKLGLKQAKNSKELSQVLNENKRIIDDDFKTDILQEVSSKFENLVTEAMKIIKDSKMDVCIKSHLPGLEEFFNNALLQPYIKPTLHTAFNQIQEQVIQSIKQGVFNVSRFFTESFSNTGDKVLTDYQLFLNNEFMKNQIKIVILGVQRLKILTQTEEGGFKFDEMFQSFIQDSIEYLQRVKENHRNSLKANPKENIAALNNMKFTNEMVSKTEFQDLMKALGEFYKDEVKRFNDELEEYPLKTSQDQTIQWLEEMKSFLLSQQFIQDQRQEQQRIEFYKKIGNNYDQLMQASHVDDQSIVKGKTSQIQKIAAEYHNKFMDQIQKVIREMNSELDRVKTSPQNNNFDVLYNSLKAIQDNIPVSRQLVEQAIFLAQKAIQQHLNDQVNKARHFYQNDKSVKLGEVTKILVKIQQMLENSEFFRDLIMNTLDYIFEDYQSLRGKDPQAAVNLQNELRGYSEPQGPFLAQNHKYFSGTNILEANKLFLNKTIDEVIAELDGTDITQSEKQQIVDYFQQYLEIYQDIITDKLTVRRDTNGEKLPIDYSSIISNIKGKLSSELSQKWNEDDIFGEISWGSPVRKSRKLALLLANIFALWTLMNSDYYQKQQSASGQNENDLKNYLLQAHPAQVVSILRMLGVGYSKQYTVKATVDKVKKMWGKFFGSGEEDVQSDIRNNLVQIKTGKIVEYFNNYLGEGKSVTLAIISVVFALNGFEVNCACYSDYLSARDFEDFRKFFSTLGLIDFIKYGTFNEIAEYQINRQGDIRDSFLNLVLQQQYQKPISSKAGQSTQNRPLVLLIDEVDVFYSDEFFGQTYNPQALIKHEAISALIDIIWKYRENKLQQLNAVNKNKKAKEEPATSKMPYMSLKSLKNHVEYKNALNIFKPEFQQLLEEACKKMIIEVFEFQSESHEYVVYQEKIGYQQQDKISTNISKGYKTLFAYYDKWTKGEITLQSLIQNKAIGINCAQFSYAEVPLDYNIILGVTGTLKSLSNTQKKIIEDLYGIQHFTYAPSVHSNEECQTFNPIQGTIIIKNSGDYNKELVKEMQTKFLKFDRPTLIFFENGQKLNEFKDSKQFKGMKMTYQILSEKDNNNEKQNKILKATQSRQITLTTKVFGRGTDFRCYDRKVIEQGGLVVIQTFLSQDESEETQIRGRTGRQGQSGTYIMFLKQDDLQDFNIQESDLKFSQHTYETLCHFRKKKLNDSQKELSKFREQLKDMHITSTKMLDEVHKLTKNDSQANANTIKDLSHYLLEQNRGITVETSDLFMKVLILIDCTGSMGVTLQKTKNCVRAMINEARAELKKKNLSEDIILIKIGGYRNYSSLEEKLFQVSTGWTSDPNELATFLDKKLQISGGQGNEAMEIGLQFANNEIENDDGIPLSMVIIIGDAPPNTSEEVELKRRGAIEMTGNPDYWSQTKNYKQPTYWEKELKKVKEAGVPVHSFYTVQIFRNQFEKLTVNDGKCAFLDINDEKKGQEQLKDFFKYLIVYRATEINQGMEEALKSVKDIKISFN